MSRTIAAVMLLLAPLLAAGETRPLFVIERSLNRNVLHYEANLDGEGRLDPERPVSAYWVMVEKGGVREDLTMLEKAKAYGFTTAPIEGGRGHYLRLKALETRMVRVKQEGEAVWAETPIGKRLCTLEKICIRSEGDRLIPKVLSIDLHGTDRKTGEPCRETIPGD
jgi:hypothetical protein